MSSLNQGGANPGKTGCEREEAPVVPARRAYWRSLDDLHDTEDFRAWMHREFPSDADLLEGEDRRQFMKVMGASFALAGLGVAACRRIPETHIVPYSARPAGRVPGQPIYFASASERGGVAKGLLVRSIDGRPINLEGNPEHPTSVGACDSITQSGILEAYDPHRSRFVLRDGVGSNAAAFATWSEQRFGVELRKSDGAGLAVLAECSGSPSMQRMRDDFMAAFPKATWHEWEPITGDEERAGTELAFGSPQRVHPNLEPADIVVCLDADPLSTHPNASRLARDWASNRRLDAKNSEEQQLSRVYAVEGVLSITGMSADDRMAVRSGDVAAVAASIARGVGVSMNGLEELAGTAAFEGRNAEILAAMIRDLKAHPGRCIVMAGRGQPPAVHALTAVINEALGNVGETVTYTDSPAPSRIADIRSLTESLDGGSVETLVVIGGNPVYDAPADLDFATAIGRAKEVVHLSLRANATSAVSTWHLPRTHFLESWGDVRAYDGTISIVQPTIQPMMPIDQKGWSPIELLAQLSGAEPGAGYDIVRATEAARSRTSGTTFESHWRQILNAGIIEDTAWPMTTPSLDAGRVSGGVGSLAAARSTIGADDLELVFTADARIYDGRFANLGWLQELPDAVTKITWDNALLVSPSLYKAKGLRMGDVVSVNAGGREIEAAIFPVPGMAAGTLAISLGWGQGEDAGPIAADAGFDAYPVRTTTASWIADGATISSTGGTYSFAQTQDHGAMDALIPDIPLAGIQERLPTLVRETNLEDYRGHPDFAKHRVHVAHRLSLWEETNLDGAKFRWAMSIDLNTCIGCGSCVTACQAENNIPIVGKDQIARGREMSWIRIDRYFKGDDPSAPEAVFVQPVTCMQCENAPCEQVCPVAATVHDKDGLNVMVYNRCIGTRYCSNNCPYKVRRFNWFDYWRREPIREQEGIFAVKPDYYTSGGPDEWRRMQMNPDVTVRNRGVMEKCSFCVQRINAAKIEYKNKWAQEGGTATSPDWNIPDGAIKCACEQACSTGSMVFGDLNDPNSEVSRLMKKQVSYQLLEELNTKPRVRYLAKVSNPGVPFESAHDDHHDDDHHGGHAAAANLAEEVRS
ncbi:MAG: molybdopterin oxidoreductase [Planctomycetaceae bacterium]|nr:molybdopterin oxidoreductase [Planctomycetaceae bacterium]